MPKKILTCYLVGGGYMSATHIDCYIQNPSVEVLGIIDPNEEKGRRLAESKGLRWFHDLDSAFAFRPSDFCDICLPSFLHRDAAVSAMALGADVICEKPFARYAEDAEAMIRTSEELGRRLMIAHVCRFMPQYYKTKALLEGGTLGKPMFLSITRESPTPMWSVGNWLFDMDKSGGTILDLSIHDIDIALWYLGNPTSMSATLIEKNDMQGLGISISSLGFSKGAAAEISANHLLPDKHTFDTSFRITLTDGYIEYSSAMPERLSVWQGNVHSIIDLSVEPGFGNAYQHELDSFVDAELNGTPFPISAEEAFQAVRVGCDLIGSLSKSVI